MTWPEPPGAGPLGDGRHAVARDRPDTIDELIEVVSRGVAEGHAIYPQGGGTALDSGGVPARPGVAIDTRGLDRVIDYPAADMTITVEAGMTLGALQATLAAQGQRLPLEAPFPDRATLGGIFATNTCGPRRFGLGRPRDFILGVSFVTADGVLVKGGGRVVKNVAGYDLPKLLTGSLGTLGIIAGMTLKVRPKPEATALVFVPFDDADALHIALERLNTSDTRPVALDVVNETGFGRIEPSEDLGLGDPAWVLIVGFEDNAAAVSWQLDRLLDEVGKGRSDVAIREGGDADPYWSALTEFQALECGHNLTIVANVRRSATMPLIRDLESSRWHVQAHAGSGIIRAHASDEFPAEVLVATIARLRAQAVAAGGNLILSRCPTKWKQHLRVWGEPRGDWPLMEKVKRALDPSGVMNPGRFVGTI